MKLINPFRDLHTAFVLARSLKRIADALERQNQIREVELLEMHHVVVPDPKKKWTKQERETEIVYGEQPTNEEEEDVLG